MKRVKFFIFILPFLFSSCSQTESDSTYSVNDTLKSVLVTKGESAIWTNELEPKFLTETLESYDKVSKDIKLSPEVLNIADSDAEKIYPQLKDFGSLDTESLSVSTGKIIKDFFDSQKIWRKVLQEKRKVTMNQNFLLHILLETVFLAVQKFRFQSVCITGNNMQT